MRLSRSSFLVIANGTITGNVLVDKNPDLWWPVGHGEQNLYKMTLNLVDSQNKSLVSVQKVETDWILHCCLNQGVNE